VTYVNANCLNIAARDPQYLALLNRFDLVYSDGIGVVWAGRFLNGKRLHKVTGRDWIAHFCAVAEQQGLSIYLLAGKPGIAQRACQRMESQWPGIKIVGTADGYFIEKSEQQVIEEIDRSRPQFLFVGMGVPLQEKWIARNLGVYRFRSAGPWALFGFVKRAPGVPRYGWRLALEWPRRSWLIRWASGGAICLEPVSLACSVRNYWVTVCHPYLYAPQTFAAPHGQRVVQGSGSATVMQLAGGSAGIWAMEGSPAAHRKPWSERGLDLSSHRAQGATVSLRRFDLVLTMERGHKEALQAEFPDLANRVYLLNEMVDRNGDVRDPIGGTIVDYEDTARELEQILVQGLEKIVRLAYGT
jgi:exopolysaccharide biosynthesis WecB/TagA/CpsF family protein